MWVTWAVACGCDWLVKGGIVSRGDTGMEYLCDGIYKGKAIVYTSVFRKE
jgi:hypothetical protein